MKEIKPPATLPTKRIENQIIFLAGSIEMGTAEHWQTEVAAYFKNRTDIILLNPRREDWNTSWEQKIENPYFFEQVNWELTGLDTADKIIMYFSPNTKSPISLLELGLYASSGKLLVCCPEGFWRKGNVDIVCKRYGIPSYENLDVLLQTNF